MRWLTKIKLRMANSVDPDETARSAVSSGSTLFAQVSYWVSRAGRVVNILKYMFGLHHVFKHKPHLCLCIE